MNESQDSCPDEHARFGTIEKCPWCDARRCPLNMADHIEVNHWPFGR